MIDQIITIFLLSIGALSDGSIHAIEANEVSHDKN